MAGDAEQRFERADCARGDDGGAALGAFDLGSVDGDVGEAERVDDMLKECGTQLAGFDQFDRVVAQDCEDDAGKPCPAADVEP